MDSPIPTQCQFLNSTISYYTKGAVIGFVLDTYLRKKSKGRHDLDEVMRKMYELVFEQTL